MASVHPRGTYYHACMQIGAPQPKWESTKLTDKREAQTWASHRETKLKEEYAREHPVEQPSSADPGAGVSNDAPVAAIQGSEAVVEKSFLDRLEAVRDKLARDGPWATSNVRQHNTVK